MFCVGDHGREETGSLPTNVNGGERGGYEWHEQVRIENVNAFVTDYLEYIAFCHLGFTNKAYKKLSTPTTTRRWLVSRFATA